jgi:hypothetical protein
VIITNNRSQQKQKERAQLEDFLESSGMIPYDKIVHLEQKEEPPVFEIIYNGQTYALEVTKLRRSGHIAHYALPKIEAYQERILTKVKEELDSRHLPCTKIEILFRKVAYPNQGYDENAIIAALVDLIVNHMEDHKPEEFPIRIPCPQIPGIGLVLITSGITNNTHRLYKNRVGRILLHAVKFDPKEIEEAIRKKEKALINYRPYHQKYLLLTVNRRIDSQAFALTNEFQNTIFLTKFDKIFFGEIANKLCLELKTVKVNF